MIGLGLGDLTTGEITCDVLISPEPCATGFADRALFLPAADPKSDATFGPAYDLGGGELGVLAELFLEWCTRARPRPGT